MAGRAGGSPPSRMTQLGHMKLNERRSEYRDASQSGLAAATSSLDRSILGTCKMCCLSGPALFKQHCCPNS
jgi:hypothetical protein